MNKYRNRKITYNGKIFDSKAEYKRYKELLMLEKCGVIKNLQRQIEYELIPKQKLIRPVKGHKSERKAVYIADFVYEKNGEVIVEDVKGIRTSDYILKRKLMLFVHKIQISEVVV